MTNYFEIAKVCIELEYQIFEEMIVQPHVLMIRSHRLKNI
jgi:hypothetical protein